jgi:hypothetical protein
MLTEVYDATDRTCVGIALPDTPLHHMYVARISKAMESLRVAVFWVAPDGQVRVEGLWLP